MNISEIWRPMVGYEGLYEVSNWGRVRSLDKLVNQWRGGKRPIKGKIIKQQINRGYYVVGLWKNGKHEMHSVHRLVAEAFIPNPENKPCIDHINGKRDVNRVENLRWCTYKENNSFEIARERKKETWNQDGERDRRSKAMKEAANRPEAKYKRSKAMTNNQKISKPVIQYTKDGQFIAEYPSQTEAERKCGVSQQNISNCCRGKLKSTGGYIWKYKDGVG